MTASPSPRGKVQVLRTQQEQVKEPDESFEDLKVLCSRRSAPQWRQSGHHLNQLQVIRRRRRAMEEGDGGGYSEAELSVLNSRRRENNHLKEREDRSSELVVNLQLAYHHSDKGKFGQDVENVFDSERSRSTRKTPNSLGSRPQEEAHSTTSSFRSILKKYTRLSSTFKTSRSNRCTTLSNLAKNERPSAIKTRKGKAQATQV